MPLPIAISPDGPKRSRAEISLSRARTENRLQSPVAHLAYPHGNKLAAGRREFALARGAGFKTAVTTRPAMIFSQTADHLTALPRVSLNGDYQDARILPLLTSGRGHRDVEWFTPRRRGVEITTNRCLWPRCSRKRRWCGHP